MTGSEITHYH